MPMDAVFLHGLTQELTQSLTGARIDKVQQPERDLLLLSVRTQSGNAKLLVHGGVGSAPWCNPPVSSRRRAPANSIRRDSPPRRSSGRRASCRAHG